jgi:hypothetical protein
MRQAHYFLAGRRFPVSVDRSSSGTPRRLAPLFFYLSGAADSIIMSG